MNDVSLERQNTKYKFPFMLFSLWILCHMANETAKHPHNMTLPPPCLTVGWRVCLVSKPIQDVMGRWSFKQCSSIYQCTDCFSTSLRVIKMCCGKILPMFCWVLFSSHEHRQWPVLEREAYRCLDEVLGSFVASWMGSWRTVGGIFEGILLEFFICR